MGLGLQLLGKLGLGSVSRQQGKPLTDDQVDFYRMSGFIGLDDITTSRDVARIRAIAERLIDERVGFDEGAQFEAMGDDEGPSRFIQIFDPQNYAKELNDTVFIRHSRVIARQILGPTARLSGMILFYKAPAIGTATPWHQDEAFYDPQYEPNYITFWLPLQQVDRTNGCLEFISGSHVLGVLSHDVPNGDHRVHALECVEGFDPSGAIPWPLAVGGATIHHCRTLHYTRPNESNAPRYSLAAVFDTTPNPIRRQRYFPWQAGQKTARQERVRKWRRHGGFVIEFWRGARKLDLRDHGRVVFYARRLFSRIRSRGG